MKNYPLVSIGVLTFNSCKTIIDTLDSIAAQTYPNLELIISDDGSTDETINLINNWIHNYNSRFKRIGLITVPENTGIPSNCNRVWSAANGNWLKLIAGDDCLLDTCITDNMEFVAKHPDAEIVYSNHLEFETSKGEFKIIREMPKQDFIQEFDSSPIKQLSVFLTLGPNITPSLFIKKDLISRMRGFSQKYKFFEDAPFIAKVLKNNIKIWHLPKPTVLYRVGNSSVSNTGSDGRYYNIPFMECFMQFRKEDVAPLFPWYRIRFWSHELSRRYDYFICTKILKNRKSKCTQYVRRIFWMLDPYRLFVSARRRLN